MVNASFVAKTAEEDHILRQLDSFDFAVKDGVALAVGVEQMHHGMIGTFHNQAEVLRGIDTAQFVGIVGIFDGNFVMNVKQRRYGSFFFHQADAAFDKVPVIV